MPTLFESGAVRIMLGVCGRGHTAFKCPYGCLGRIRWYYEDERDAALADSAPIPTEDE